jgi:hypothetical protein
MENYALSMQGHFITEKVLNIPVWTASDIGRFIYVISLDRYFIGAASASIDDDGWAIIGLYNDTITDRYIDWDTNLDYVNDKISSINIPTMYSDTTTNIQIALDDIFDSISLLSSGDLISDGGILPRHIGFEAKDIKLPDDLIYFKFSPINPFPSIKDVLYELHLRTAKDLKLSSNTIFGQYFTGVDTSNVEQALISLEEYLSSYPSQFITIINPVPNPVIETSLQVCIDSIYGEIVNQKFTDLIDVPNTYGLQNQFVMTDGVGLLKYADIYGDMINVQYPSSTPTNVQLALNAIRSELDIIILGGPLDPLTRDLTTINASNVIYDNSVGVTSMANVDDILDYLLTHAYTISRKPTAVDITCTGIGSSPPQSNNVQSALEHLQDYLNQAIGLIPSCLKASDIYYNSIKGQLNVDSSLDYLFTNDLKILALENCCTVNTSKINKQKVYFTSYSIDSNFNPCGGFPISLSFDFSNWYLDYKLNFNPDVINNFIVVPIIQLNSFVVPNAYQKFKCSSWSNPNPADPLFPGNCLSENFVEPIHVTWPPKMVLSQFEEKEAGTLGEYAYVYYNSGPVQYLDPDKKWTFELKLGTRSFEYGKRDFTIIESLRNTLPDRSYSTGGDASYTMLFFGFGTDSNSLLKILDSYCVTPCLYPSTGTHSAPVLFKLTINFIGVGSVTGTGPGLSFTCIKDDNFNFANGTVIVLLATSVTTTFVKWAGVAVIVGNSCTVTLNSDITVTVEFAAIIYLLTTLIAPTGGGIISSSDSTIICGLVCSYSYTTGTIVSLTATYNSGYDFVEWTGDHPSPDTEIHVTMDKIKTVTANFIVSSTPSVLLNIVMTPAIGGTVTSADGKINCTTAVMIPPVPSNCSATYTTNVPNLALTITPNSLYKIDTIDGVISGSIVAVTITRNIDITGTGVVVNIVFALIP